MIPLVCCCKGGHSCVATPDLFAMGSPNFAHSTDGRTWYTWAYSDLCTPDRVQRKGSLLSVVPTNLTSSAKRECDWCASPAATSLVGESLNSWTEPLEAHWIYDVNTPGDPYKAVVQLHDKRRNLRETEARARAGGCHLDVQQSTAQRPRVPG